MIVYNTAPLEQQIGNPALITENLKIINPNLNNISDAIGRIPLFAVNPEFHVTNDNHMEFSASNTYYTDYNQVAFNSRNELIKFTLQKEDIVIIFLLSYGPDDHAIVNGGPFRKVHVYQHGGGTHPLPSDIRKQLIHFSEHVNPSYIRIILVTREHVSMNENPRDFLLTGFLPAGIPENRFIWWNIYWPSFYLLIRSKDDLLPGTFGYGLN
jgi:hypothetical protein